MKMQTILGAAAVASIAAIASAEVDIDFAGFTAAGSQFTMLDANALTGTLDGAFGDFALDADGVNWTWADDLTVMIGADDLSALNTQIGGYSDYGAANRFSWAFGSAGAAGTTAGGDVATGAIDVSGNYLFLGNGYGSGGDGVWTGHIDLNGDIAHVPAPGALALLGLSGLAARRRRRA